jgi:hypothetical protein
MSMVEFLRFRIRPNRADALLSARAEAVDALRTRPGFRSAYLVELEEEEWLDVTIWDGVESAADSIDDGGKLPAVAAYNDLITEVVGEERGLLVQDW